MKKSTGRTNAALIACYAILGHVLLRAGLRIWRWGATLQQKHPDYWKSRP